MESQRGLKAMRNIRKTFTVKERASKEETLSLTQNIKFLWAFKKLKPHLLTWRVLLQTH